MKMNLIIDVDKMSIITLSACFDLIPEDEEQEKYKYISKTRKALHNILSNSLTNSTRTGDIFVTNFINSNYFKFLRTTRDSIYEKDLTLFTKLLLLEIYTGITNTSDSFLYYYSKEIINVCYKDQYYLSELRNSIDYILNKNIIIKNKLDQKVLDKRLKNTGYLESVSNKLLINLNNNRNLNKTILTIEFMKSFKDFNRRYKNISDIRNIRAFLIHNKFDLNLLDLDYIDNNYEYGKKFTKELIRRLI